MEAQAIRQQLQDINACKLVRILPTSDSAVLFETKRPRVARNPEPLIASMREGVLSRGLRGGPVIHATSFKKLNAFPFPRNP